MRPTLRQLEYLVALADALNFRRAAEACFVTQPALSTQIKQLETLIGVKLFERDRRHVVPTAAGEAMAVRARKILTDVDDWVGGVRQFAEPLAGPLRLGVIPTVAPYLLPPALKGLSARFPKLRLLLREESTDRCLDLLARGELDLALLAREAELGAVTVLDLFSDPFLLALPGDHPLAKRKRLPIGDVPMAELLLLEDGH
jgi:LysR family transcriptional regulator, hydrogen peroxide-inducible genes activator